MKAIRLLHTQNIISRHKQRLQQDLAFSVLVENVAYDELVEVHWAGEDGVWRTLPAEHRASLGSDLEIWCAQAGLIASEDESLPGDIEFALHYRVRGRDFWDNNGSRDYFSNADSGVLLHQDLPLLHLDFNPILHQGCSTLITGPCMRG